MAAQGIGFENKWFRRFHIRKRQRVVVVVLMLLSGIAAIISTLSCSYSELVKFSVDESIYAVPRTGGKPEVLLPSALVQIGFTHAWVGYHRYARSAVDVPALFTQDSDVNKFATSIDQVTAYHQARKHFSVGYSFGQQCALSTALAAGASTRSISEVTLAAHIVLILSLVVFFIATTILFRTLSEESFLYHNIDRKFISYDHAELSREYYETIYRQVLAEQKLFLLALRSMIAAAFVCTLCGICTVCGCLYMFYPHCPQGFCSSFHASITQLVSVFETPSAQINCRLGVTTIIGCCAIPFCVTLLVLSIVFRLIIWKDDRDRQVEEVMRYLCKICQVSKAGNGVKASLFEPTIVEYTATTTSKGSPLQLLPPPDRGETEGAPEPIGVLQDFSSLYFTKLPPSAASPLPPPSPQLLTPLLPPIYREFPQLNQRMLDLQVEETQKRQSIQDASIVQLKRRIDNLNAELLEKTGTIRSFHRDPTKSGLLLSTARGRRR